jgi:hypothetical protein
MMARNPDQFIEENAEQRDEDQAQDVADEAVTRRFNDTGPEGRDPTQDTEHGGHPNPAGIIPEDTPDLVDTMNQMLTSGRIDNNAYAGEPMMDDEESLLGDTEDVDDDEDDLAISDAVQERFAEGLDEGEDEQE